jgi:hypothetical protein
VKPILREASIGDILNYEHEIGSKTTSLLRVNGNAFDLFPNEVDHAKWWCPIPHVG